VNGPGDQIHDAILADAEAPDGASEVLVDWLVVAAWATAESPDLTVYTLHFPGGAMAGYRAKGLVVHALDLLRDQEE
jgi:hypothetical protein